MGNLEEFFRLIGVPNPESWAASQLTENLPQTERAMILRKAWGCINAPDTTDWIEAAHTLPPTDSTPCGDLGDVVRRLLGSGANKSDLCRLVRIAQFEAIAGFLYALDDSSDRPDWTKMACRDWAIFALSNSGEPQEEVSGLSESFLSMDPAGKEMRP